MHKDANEQVDRDKAHLYMRLVVWRKMALQHTLSHTAYSVEGVAEALKYVYVKSERPVGSGGLKGRSTLYLDGTTSARAWPKAQ